MAEDQEYVPREWTWLKNSVILLLVTQSKEVDSRWPWRGNVTLFWLVELKVFRNQTQLNLTQNQPSVVIKQMNVAETKLVEIHCFENAHVQNYDYF